ncbi:hypothetical protein IW140_005024 [Coemansia sp. RSA 1813]|nr:hypothetical protein IW140_005024 [Coemansia sp. RSA 1813]
MAKVMVVFMVLAEVGPQKMLEIKTDLRAAIGALEALQRRDPKSPWRSSPVAALLERDANWFDKYWDCVKFVRVKERSGNLHNAERDRLAGSAHGNERLTQLLKLGAPPTVPFWAC